MIRRVLRERHGRWPLVAAASALPATALAVRRPALRPLAALFLHQTEEWVWPGGFLPWINREILDCEDDEFPIDRRIGFLINVVFGWGTSAVAAACPAAAAPASLLYTSHLGNAALHTGWAIRHRRYDPGTVTALLTLTPVAVAGLRQLYADPRASRRAMLAGSAAGLGLSAVLVPLLKLRVRRRAARPVHVSPDTV